MPSSRVSRPEVMTLVGVALLVGGAVRVLWLLLVERDASAADQVSSTLGYVLAAGGAVIALLGWLRVRRRADRVAPTAEQVDQAVATLAGQVLEQWDDEARIRGLDDPEPIPVRWRLTTDPDVMDRRDVVLAGNGPNFDGEGSPVGGLGQAFRGLRHRRLVIVGGPGSGKTTLAVHLVRELLLNPEPDAPLRVPVLFSLADWDPDVQPCLRDFLVAQLDRTYPALAAVAPPVARTVVRQHRILPVLDGLDEIAAPRRGAVLRALNTDLGRSGVVLTSRLAEYSASTRAARDVLTGAAVIEPLPLTAAEAAAHLRLHAAGAPRRWEEILDRLADDRLPALAEVTRTALGLWLVRAAYLGPARDPAPLVDSALSDARALRAHLFDRLVPALVEARRPHRDDPLRPTRAHDPDDLRRWLTGVAEHLRDAGIRDWRWWELHHRTLPGRDAALVALVATFGAVGAVVAGVTIGAVTLLEGRPTALPMMSEKGAAVGAVVGAVAGFVNWLQLLLRPPVPVRWTSMRSTPSRSQVVGYVSWTAAATTAGTTFGSDARDLGFGAGPVWGTAWGAAAGLLISAVFVSFSPTAAERAASPARSFAGDRAYDRVSRAMWGVLVGGAFGLVLAPVSAPGTTLAAGVSTGLVAAATVGSVGSAWTVFQTAVLPAALRRRLPAPWRVMSVLDDCHRLGLLRAVGPAYQFRHAELQDHLAPPRGAAVSPPSAPAASRSS